MELDLKKIIHFFNNEDGSLPDIIISSTKEADLLLIFKNLLTKSEKIPDNITTWDEAIKKEVSCNSYQNLEDLFIKLKENSSGIPLIGLEQQGTILPELSIYVLENELELVYRPGKEWNTDKLKSLILLLKDLKERFKSIEVYLNPEGEAPFTIEEVSYFNRILKSLIS